MFSLLMLCFSSSFLFVIPGALHGVFNNESSPHLSSLPLSAMLAAAELEWTVEQQKQLEGGLKSVPVKDAHRWENIALLVDGKNKKECLARYKELVRKMNEAKK